MPQTIEEIRRALKECEDGGYSLYEGMANPAKDMAFLLAHIQAQGEVIEEMRNILDRGYMEKPPTADGHAMHMAKQLDDISAAFATLREKNKV
jgi:hypothetical protein